MDLVLTVRDRVRLEAQAQRARERLAVLARETNRLTAEQQTVLGDLRRLELVRERHAVEEQAARTAGTLARAAVADTTRQLHALEASRAARAPAVRARLRRLYQLGPLDAPRHWLSAQGLVESARAWRLLAAVAAKDRAELMRAARQLADLGRLRAAQETQLAEADRHTRAAEAARAAASRAAADRQALVARLGRDRDLAARYVRELQEADARLASLLKEPSGPGARAPVVLPLAPFKGDLEWPVHGEVTMRFGRERQSRFGTVLPRTGIAIAAPPDTPVAVVHEGRVVFAAEFAGLGRLVIVEHGTSAFSLYGHLTEARVQRGDAVPRGTTLGTTGSTPEGAQGLYFELRVDGRPVDPLEWLKPAIATRSRP